jgi:hypothetical protein
MLLISIFIVSFLLSIPSFLLFSILFKDLHKRPLKPLIKKLVLSLCGIIFISLTFYIIGLRSFNSFNDLLIPIVYITIFTTCVYLLNTEKIKTSA